MNIAQAKEHIKKSIQIYLAKDEYGSYRIPISKQRPVFLLGAPGIGKTAIMEQIAQEMDIALVSYSMTHHTRQSALGLPFISHKSYHGEQFDVSEYTMSEIIASVYDVMEKSGKKEGILFLDEINCVSETLAPSMLQFLQYKTFGKHQVPEGWVIATAGNPPQFNRSVREFDIVTLDRLKILEVEADYPTWKNYALNKGIHGAILTYLDIKKQDFYIIENTVDGKAYVTARGWEDLSEAMYLYEENNFDIDLELISQYVRNKRIAREFSAYYDLYQKYKKDYRIGAILAGDADKEIIKRAKAAPFDERLSLINLLLDSIEEKLKNNITFDDSLRRLLGSLKGIKGSFEQTTEWDNDTVRHILASNWESLEKMLSRKDDANALSNNERRSYQFVIKRLQRYARDLHLNHVTNPEAAFGYIKTEFDKEVSMMKEDTSKCEKELVNLFDFVETTFGAENEMLILVTDLTVNQNCAKFLGRHTIEAYNKYNKRFQIYERQKELAEAVDKLDL